MYKGDFLREVCWNFTYQIEKMHFGMYTLDCFATLAMSRTLCVLTKFCFAKLAAMTRRMDCHLVRWCFSQ